MYSVYILVLHFLFDVQTVHDKGFLRHVTVHARDLENTIWVGFDNSHAAHYNIGAYELPKCINKHQYTTLYYMQGTHST